MKLPFNTKQVKFTFFVGFKELYVFRVPAFVSPPRRSLSSGIAANDSHMKRVLIDVFPGFYAAPHPDGLACAGGILHLPVPRDRAECVTDKHGRAP